MLKRNPDTPIVWAFWDYAKAMGLQEDEEKRQVRCDHVLRSRMTLSS